jgi:hypothetical protein
MVGGQSSDGDGGGINMAGGLGQVNTGGSVSVTSGSGGTASGDISVSTADSEGSSGSVSIATGTSGVCGVHVPEGPDCRKGDIILMVGYAANPGSFKQSISTGQHTAGNVEMSAGGVREVCISNGLWRGTKRNTEGAGGRRGGGGEERVEVREPPPPRGV